MKVYTRKGDAGYTTLMGNIKVKKNDIRLEAYGTVDELNCHTGMLRDLIQDKEIRSWLLTIQKKMMTASSMLAYDKSIKVKLPRVNKKDVEWLEAKIDLMNKSLTPLHQLIIPGGDTSVSQANICRAVCRRAERLLVTVQSVFEMDNILLIYFNRLSDFFYILSRFLVFKNNINESVWNSHK